MKPGVFGYFEDIVVADKILRKLAETNHRLSLEYRKCILKVARSGVMYGKDEVCTVNISTKPLSACSTVQVTDPSAIREIQSACMKVLGPQARVTVAVPVQ